MNLPDINLDDRSFEQLLAEGNSIIANQFPYWIKENYSDPAITLTELFSYLIKNSLQQMNEIKDENLINFTKLLGVKTPEVYTMKELLIKTYQHITDKSRTMTLSDFEYHAKNFYYHMTSSQPIQRAKAVLKSKTYQENLAEDYVAVTILPAKDKNINQEELCKEVFFDLQNRSLITSRIKVVTPKYKGVFIFVEITPDKTRYYSKDNIIKDVQDSVKKFVDSYSGGIDGKGWEFGRALYASELNSIINNISGVDYIKSLHMMNLESEYNAEEEAINIFKSKANKQDKLEMDEASLYDEEKVIVVCNILDKY